MDGCSLSQMGQQWREGHTGILLEECSEVVHILPGLQHDWISSVALAALVCLHKVAITLLHVGLVRPRRGWLVSGGDGAGACCC